MRQSPILGEGEEFFKEGLTPLLDTPNENRREETKPHRAGGWEEKRMPKTGRGFGLIFSPASALISRVKERI